MPIADVDREKILESLKEFDLNLRGSPEWVDWEGNQAHRHAIEFEGQQYPPKKILSLATGLPVSSFSGGPETNNYLEHRGFKIVPLRKELLNELLEKILADYPTTRAKQPFDSKNEMWKLFEKCRDVIEDSDVVGSFSRVRVKMSVGQGNWAKVPWIVLFDERETSTTQRGVYVVCLFRQDGSGVYLTLNQGVTEPQKRLGSRGGLEELREKAKAIRAASLTEPLKRQGFSLDDSIDLRADPGLGRDYEASTIAFKLYERGHVPEDAQLFSDIHALLSSYGQYLNERVLPSEEREICLIGTSRSAALSSVQDWIRDHGAWASWWSFPIKGEARKSLAKPFDLYINTGGGRIEFRLHVSACATSEGSEGMESPWADITEPEERGKTRKGTKQSEVFKTWFQVTNVEQLKPPLSVSQFEPVPGLSTADGLLNQMTFGYAFPPSTDSGMTIERGLSMDELVANTLLERAFLEEIINALRGDSPQVVLAGPPGTSKTWVAQALAEYITGSPDRVKLVQFHPNYSYEAFVEGLRPIAENGGISFKAERGVLLDIVKDMNDRQETASDSPLYVIVIDEMNRANLPRVFGELMYLFEYRNKSIRLQYSKDFKLPPNLRFIGTMNTADRSIRSIDVALRRRFDVFELSPDGTVLERYFQTRTCSVPKLVDGLGRLNEDLAGRLDRHHTIGHSFLMKENLDRRTLEAIWRRKIKPLIEEYFFDQLDIAAEFEIAKYWPEAARSATV